MKRLAYVFPGQGSQFVGMCKSFYEGSKAAKRVFEEANDAAGFDLARLAFEGPQDELDKTENTQPALLAASFAALKAFEEREVHYPFYFAGHSLGEYTALVAAHSLELSDAVKLVRMRGVFMQDSVAMGEGKMCAILGLGIDDVAAICASASTGNAVVVPANINSPEQIVISGHAAAVDTAAGLARERGAKRVVPLQVSAPSHSPLMEKAAGRLASVLEDVEILDFSAPIVSNVEAMPLKSAHSVKGLLARQLTSPVRWVDIVRRMKKDGVTHIVEIGPGKVLTGLVKRIEKDIVTLNVGEFADIDKTHAAINAAAE